MRALRTIAVGAGPRTRIRVSPGVGEPQDLSSLRHRAGRLRRARRRFTIRWLKPFLTALAIVGAPTAGVAWLMTSPRFALRELAVLTGERVPEAWARQALAPLQGQNLTLLPLARAERLLRRHPWVQGAALRKDLPSRLAVRVTERRAVGLLRAGTELYYVDAEGARIAPFDPAMPAEDLPLLSLSDPRLRQASALPAPAETPASQSDLRRDEAAGVRAAVRLLAEIEEVEPTWAAGLSEIEVLGEEDFRVYTVSLSAPVLVRSGTLNQKARRLEELLPHIALRYGAAAAIDLRFARRIIVQPSVEPGSAPPRPPAETEHRKATADHAQRG